MPFPCYWKDCTEVKRDRAALLTHMYSKHWPQSIREYVCEYCERGYTNRAGLLSHLRSRSHRDKAETAHDKVNLKEIALEWTAKHKSVLRPDHYEHLCRFEQKDQQDVEEDPIIVSLQVDCYTPTHPGIHDDDVQPSQTTEDIPHQTKDILPHQPKDTQPNQSKDDQYNQTNLSHQPDVSHQANQCNQTSNVPHQPDKPHQADQCNQTSNVPHQPDKPHQAKDTNKQTNSAVPHQVTITPTEDTPAAKPQPLSVPQLVMPSTSTARAPAQRPTPLPYPQPPSSLTDTAGNPPPSKRQRLQDQLEEAEDTTEMMFLMARHFDSLAARMDNLEATLKSKFRDISYEQSRHLVGEFTQIAQGEAFQVKTYMRQLIQALRKDM